MLRTLFLAALVAAVFAPSALAQPDIGADPTYGTISLETGFTPDPVAVDVVAGGPDEVTIDGCYGYVYNAAPDVDFSFDTDGDLPLKIFVRSSEDTVLLVNMPDGEWVCNDDFDGTNAAVEFDTPMSGLYNIWVGTFGETDGADATLYFTELPEVEIMLDASATKEELSLVSGFSPDPVEIAIGVDGIDQNPFEQCAGFVNANGPDATLDFETDGGLPLFIYAESDEEDLTLMVVGPDDEINCNDDAAGLNPGLSYDEPMAGRYSIWVGSYSARGREEDGGTALLYISELEGPTLDDDYDYEGPDFGDYDPANYSGGDDLSLFARPTAGSVHLNPGFLPDPESVDVTMGGADAVSVEGPGCTGFISNSAPTANLVYGDGGAMLALYVEADVDGTLVVSMPNGDWICNDDDQGTNPGVYIVNPEEGLYNIWVGTFSQNDAGASGALFISESTR